MLFHKGQQPTPWACATILPFNTTVIYATATFKGVVAGQINFMQDSTNNKADVAIIGSLYYTDGRTTPSDNNGWYVTEFVTSSCYCQCRILCVGPPLTTCLVFKPPQN